MFDLNSNEVFNIPDGSLISAYYCDQLCYGKVVDSRVMYGARKQYTIELYHAVKFPWSGSDKKKGDTILVTNRDVRSYVNEEGENV